ncbi:bifunctional 3'-5' exonuclease/ATP-dependent helicase WRN-like [Saccoglossus kowalevskii]
MEGLILCYYVHDLDLDRQPVENKDVAELVLGFDIEWPVTYESGVEPKTALLQLCTSSSVCYLFHLSSMTGFPGGLKILLESEQVKKVGVGIQGDKWKLLRDYNIKCCNMEDLSALANEVTNSHENWSLDGLCKHLTEYETNRLSGLKFDRK